MSIFNVNLDVNNPKLSAVENELDKSVTTNTRKVVSTGFDRITLFTNDGYVYSRGRYGKLNFSDMYTIYSTIKIADRKTFTELELGDVKGKVKDFSSNILYDLFATDESLYLYGILPSDEIRTEDNFVTEPTLKELTYNGASVKVSSLYCHSYRECYIKTVDNKIMFIGFDEEVIEQSEYFKEKYGLISDPVIDDLNLIDLSTDLFTNDQIDFDRTFTNGVNFYFTKDGNFCKNVYISQNNFQWRMIPNPEYFLTYEDYLAQREQKYIDEIDQSIIDSYYQSIKATLPTSSNVKINN